MRQYFRRKYYALNPEVDEETDPIGWDGHEMLIKDYSIKRVESAFAEQATWEGEFYWLTGNQWDASQLLTRRTRVQSCDASVESLISTFIRT